MHIRHVPCYDKKSFRSTISSILVFSIPRSCRSGRAFSSSISSEHIFQRHWGISVYIHQRPRDQHWGLFSVFRLKGATDSFWPFHSYGHVSGVGVPTLLHHVQMFMVPIKVGTDGREKETSAHSCLFSELNNTYPYNFLERCKQPQAHGGFGFLRRRRRGDRLLVTLATAGTIKFSPIHCFLFLPVFTVPAPHHAISQIPQAHCLLLAGPPSSKGRKPT